MLAGVLKSLFSVVTILFSVHLAFLLLFLIHNSSVELDDKKGLYVVAGAPPSFDCENTFKLDFN